MMSVIQVFRRLFQFSVAFNIFKVMAFTKSQRLFMLNAYFECKNYAAIARRFHAEFNIHIDRTTISRTIKKFREDCNLTTRCATQRSKLSTDVTNQSEFTESCGRVTSITKSNPKNSAKVKIRIVETTKRAILIWNPGIFMWTEIKAISTDTIVATYRSVISRLRACQKFDGGHILSSSG